MLRSKATRSLLQSFPKVPGVRVFHNSASAFAKVHNVAPLCQLNNKRPQVFSAIRPASTSLFYATKPTTPYEPLAGEHVKKVLETKLEPHPEEISAGSSVRHVFEEGQGVKSEKKGGIRGDIETIQETFALTEVPRESLYIGAAGVIPYAATSLSTVYLAWDINHAAATGRGVLLSPETAHQLLDLVTPVQIGYGAVIISFLGAIHWGLEYAGYGGYHSYRRYMYGVLAPAVAWPTIFMPVEYALITQFFAFNFLYFADARATVRGWFPPWYSTYRFVLTFLVGASIVISLVGRGQIVRHNHSTMKNPVDYIKEDRDSQWEALEREEKDRRAKLAKEEDEEDEEEKEEEEEEEEEEATDEVEDGENEDQDTEDENEGKDDKKNSGPEKKSK